MTNYRKLDAALAGVLEGALAAGRPLPVFVHLEPDADADADVDVDVDAAEALTALGVAAGSVQGGIATATLRADQIAALSEQPFVRQIRLSSPLRFLDDQ